MKNYLWKIRKAAEGDYWSDVLRLLEGGEGGAYLDCGCGDGAKSLEMARRIGSSDVCGVEVVDELVNMITAQRAYELNSKTISMADQMLQTANNIKR